MRLWWYWTGRALARDGHETLVLSMLTGHGRATPLMWRSVESSSLKGNQRRYEDELLCRLRAVMASGGEGDGGGGPGVWEWSDVSVSEPALFTKDRRRGYGVPEICSKIMVLVQTAPQIHGARHERNHSAVFAIVQSGGVH